MSKNNNIAPIHRQYLLNKIEYSSCHTFLFDLSNYKETFDNILNFIAKLLEAYK